MCGIVGFIDSSHSFSEQKNIIFEMNSILHHRGPDDKGTWTHEKGLIAIGHTRLSILDLSSLGRQPMMSKSRKLVITYNGEIYNFNDLKKELIELGHNFKTQTDTEVLLVSIEVWGLEIALRKFKGMFAFAIWDEENKTLSLVRDRFGEKPLYYGWQKNTFMFSSEIKALKKHPSWEGNIDRQALGYYFKYSYVPTPLSIYIGIKKLSPGSIVSIQKTSSGWMQLDEVEWWSLDKDIKKSNCSYSENLSSLEKLLDNTINDQKISDVPLGAFLSGGIDSSLIVSLMQKNSMNPIKTFTIGFEEKDYDESTYAKKISNHLGTDHYEHILSSKELLDIIPLIPSLYDEPFADSSQIPTYLISKLAKKTVSVCLSGDAGDELFMGYNRYVWAPKILKFIQKNPNVFNKLIFNLLKKTPISLLNTSYKSLSSFFSKEYHFSTPIDKLEKLMRVFRFSSEFEIYDDLISTGKNKDMSIGFNDYAYNDRMNKFKSNGNYFEERMAITDIKNYLTDDILVKVDRAAMANGLETRIPFLDHEIAEFALSLPLQSKIQNGTSKKILKDILFKYIPKELLDRPKSGFGIPIDTWLRGPLKDWTNDTLNETRIKNDGYLNFESINNTLDQHMNKNSNRQHEIWNLLIFQNWIENE